MERSKPNSYVAKAGHQMDAIIGGGDDDNAQ
jgi:hypothetical protein